MLVVACGGGEEPSDDPFAASVGGPGFGDESGSDGDDGGSADDGAPGDDDGAAEDGGSDGGDAEPPPPMGLCHEAPPAGAPQPPSPKDYSGGSCPAITPGWNSGFQSDGRSREFAFIAPSDHDPTKSYPLVIAWHHINGNAMDYIAELDAQAIADERQMMFAIPQDSGMFEASWPFTPLDNDQAEVDL